MKVWCHSENIYDRLKEGKLNKYNINEKSNQLKITAFNYWNLDHSNFTNNLTGNSKTPSRNLHILQSNPRNFSEIRVNTNESVETN